MHEKTGIIIMWNQLKTVTEPETTSKILSVRDAKEAEKKMFVLCIVH